MLSGSSNSLTCESSSSELGDFDLTSNNSLVGLEPEASEFEFSYDSDNNTEINRFESVSGSENDAEASDYEASSSSDLNEEDGFDSQPRVPLKDRLAFFRASLPEIARQNAERLRQEHDATVNKMLDDLAIANQKLVHKLTHANALYQTIQDERVGLTNEHEKNVFLIKMINKEELKAVFEEFAPSKNIEIDYAEAIRFDKRLTPALNQLLFIYHEGLELYEKYTKLKEEAVIAEVKVARHNIANAVTSPADKVSSSKSGDINRLFSYLSRERGEQVEPVAVDELDNISIVIK